MENAMHGGYLPETQCGRWGRWVFIIGLMILLMNGGLFTPGPSAAERTSPIRIGVLTASWGPTPMIVGLRNGLLALGYHEEKDFVLGVRFTQGDVAALPVAAQELVQLEVDIVIADSDESAQAAQQATTRIPIVFISVADPLGLGLVKSFARPGGNITGVTDLELKLGPKRLQVFQDIIPGLRRVMFLYDANGAHGEASKQAYLEAAGRLGIELVARAVQTQDEARDVLSQVCKDEVDGLLALPSPALNINGFILEFALQKTIPAMFATAFFTERDGLASYGPDFYESGRQAARLVDKIFKGANPAEIPVEANSKIRFVINLKTAKKLGLTIPPEVLYQADRLIR